MPIGGGTFVVQNKILPGAYINFVSLGSAVRMGARGVVALALELDWGLDKKVFKVTSEDFSKTAINTFGCDPTSPSLLLVREALKQASSLLIYKINSGGEKAMATIGGVKFTSVHSGTGGNKIKGAIRANVDDDTKVDVLTFIDNMEVDFQTILATGGVLKNNSFVAFGEFGTLSATAAVSLIGGTNKEVTGASHTLALNAFEVEDFNVIGYVGTDTAIKSLYATFVKRLRDDEGRKIVGVLSQYTGDNQGIINVKNGVLLIDGTIIPSEKAVAWVAGATAGAEINQSLTNRAYDDAIDVDIKYTKSQYESAINAGEFVFYADNKKARVLSDINSLTTFGGGVSSDWTSNRVVRVMDGWANDVARIFGDSYIGLATNSDTGRGLFKADLVSLATQYQSIDAISDFLSADIVIEQGLGKRDVTVDCALMPNDSMEKLYMTVTVN